MHRIEPSTRSVLALADALRPALLRASRALRREALRAGVSALDAQLLGAVKNNPGIGVCALADREQMTRASMSGHVKRLAQAGWIARATAAGDDRRRSGLTLTERGTRALEAIRRGRNDWLAARLTRLAPAEREMLARAAGPLLSLAEERP
ncbi:MAG TPA: MarR family transcriptional regulator [Caulobacteraceae bacterium]|nr:MarR family transcriptional regulator [Caulobacteraceae bacterium]